MSVGSVVADTDKLWPRLTCDSGSVTEDKYARLYLQHPLGHPQSRHNPDFLGKTFAVSGKGRADL